VYGTGFNLIFVALAATSAAAKYPIVNVNLELTALAVVETAALAVG